jgi:hypothetical protein
VSSSNNHSAIEKSGQKMQKRADSEHPDEGEGEEENLSDGES